MSATNSVGSVLPVWGSAVRPQRGRREKAGPQTHITGRLRFHILSAMCATKHNVTERNGSAAEGTTRASTNSTFREVWAGLKQSWSGEECSEAEEH